MQTDRKKSLTETEHSIRVRFDVARNAVDNRREQLWAKLSEARGAGARSPRNRRPVAMIRLRTDVGHAAGALVSDLTNIEWVAHPQGGRRPAWIGADVPCDLLFDTALPPCERRGECPHMIAVWVEESENSATVVGKRVMRSLRKRAGRQPKVR